MPRETLQRRWILRGRWPAMLASVALCGLLAAGCAIDRGERLADASVPTNEPPRIVRLPPLTESHSISLASAEVPRGPAGSNVQLAHHVAQPEPPIEPNGDVDITDGLLSVEEVMPRLEPGVAALSVDGAIATCLRNDPVLWAGLQEVRMAMGDQITASLRPNPELEIIQSLLPLGQPFVADVREGGPPQFDLWIGYPIDWFLFGKRTAAMQSTSRGVRASQSEYADLVRVRVMQTAVAYYNVVEAVGLVALARQDVDNLLHVERLTQVAVENDARPRVELGRVRLDRLDAQQTLRDTQRELVEAMAELVELMGLRDVDVTFEVDPTLAPPSNEELLPVAEALAIAEANRPDLQAARWRVSQARADVIVERRDAFPEVVPVFGYTRQFQERAIDFPDVSSWGAGLTVGVPLFDRNQGNRARSFAAVSQSGQELRAVLVELRAEIVSLRAELETARANAIATAEQQLQLAEEVRDSINLAYEAGARPLIDVLDAQRNYRETFRNYITSRADYWRAVYRFNAALGVQRIE